MQVAFVVVLNVTIASHPRHTLILFHHYVDLCKKFYFFSALASLFSTLFEDKFPYVAMFAFVSVNGCFSLSHNNAVFKYQVYQWSNMAEIFNECE